METSQITFHSPSNVNGIQADSSMSAMSEAMFVRSRLHEKSPLKTSTYKLRSTPEQPRSVKYIEQSRCQTILDGSTLLSYKREVFRQSDQLVHPCLPRNIDPVLNPHGRHPCQVHEDFTMSYLQQSQIRNGLSSDRGAQKDVAAQSHRPRLCFVSETRNHKEHRKHSEFYALRL